MRGRSNPLHLQNPLTFSTLSEPDWHLVQSKVAGNSDQNWRFWAQKSLVVRGFRDREKVSLFQTL
jgi:hypothetical protein